MLTELQIRPGIIVQTSSFQEWNEVMSALADMGCKRGFVPYDGVQNCVRIYLENHKLWFKRGTRSMYTNGVRWNEYEFVEFSDLKTEIQPSDEIFAAIDDLF